MGLDTLCASRSRWSAVPNFQPHDRIGDYVLQEALDEGGQGYVWRARHFRAGTLVALKILTKPASLGEAGQLRRDIELMAATAANRSPYIVHVLGGSTEPVPHIVMEFVDGVDLGRELMRLRDLHGSDSGGLPQDEVIRVGTAVANALKVLHDEGIIHRDVKPTNVMLDRRGNIKLTDFGIAKIIGYHSVSLHSEHPLSLSYAAPEVWAGEPVPASDVYALGATLFELLAGKPPFVGPPASVYTKHLMQEPDLQALPAETADPVRALIRACMEKRPEDRPDADACIAVLESVAKQLGDGTAELMRHEPRRFGSWVVLAAHPSLSWVWRCVHRETGTQAQVEIFFASNVAELERATRQARRAVEVNPGLAQFGAERMYDADRVLLGPEEAWSEPAPGAFSYLVACEVPGRPGEFSLITADVFLQAAESLASLVYAAEAEGITLKLARPLLSLREDGSVCLRHAGLFADAQPPMQEAALAFLRSLPLDQSTREVANSATHLADVVLKARRLATTPEKAETLSAVPPFAPDSDDSWDTETVAASASGVHVSSEVADLARSEGAPGAPAEVSSSQAPPADNDVPGESIVAYDAAEGEPAAAGEPSAGGGVQSSDESEHGVSASSASELTPSPSMDTGLDGGTVSRYTVSLSSAGVDPIVEAEQAAVTRRVDAPRRSETISVDLADVEGEARPAYGFTAEMTPRRTSSRFGPAAFDLVLTNFGPEDTTVRLRAETAEDVLVSLPQQVLLGKGEKRSVKVSARARSGRWWGPGHPRSFAVFAGDGGNEPPRRLDASFSDDPNAWLPVSGAVAGVVLAVAAFLGVQASGGNESPEATPTSVSAQAPLPTPGPTRTPAPTATPVPQSVTFLGFSTGVGSNPPPANLTPSGGAFTACDVTVLNAYFAYAGYNSPFDIVYKWYRDDIEVFQSTRNYARGGAYVAGLTYGTSSFRAAKYGVVATIDNAALASAEVRVATGCAAPATSVAPPAVSAPPTPRPSTPATPVPAAANSQTADEQRYARQSEAQLSYISARIAQENVAFKITPGGDLQEKMIAYRQGIDTLQGLQPVPPRYQTVHNNLSAAYQARVNWFAEVPNLKTSKDIDDWKARDPFQRYKDAYTEYARVVWNRTITWADPPP